MLVVVVVAVASSISIKQAYQWIEPAGLPPPIFEPEDVESCRQWIARKNQEKAAVLIAGGTSHWFLGNNPTRVTDILSLRKWNRVVEYSPADLTVTVEAGCPLTELSDALRESGQFLPFFPVNSQSATIGGIVATGLAGPYGPALGGPRDFLIGIEVLHAEGILSHAGGKVVKNVAGYDLCKLYTGSMGSLGIITRMTFKVRPRPEDSCTMILPFDSFLQLLETALKIRDQVEPDALEAIQPGPGFLENYGSSSRFLLAIQVIGSRDLTEWKRSILRQAYAPIQILSEKEEQEFWNRWDTDFLHALQAQNQRAVLRISSPLGLLSEVYESLGEKIPLDALTGHIRNGTLFLFVSGREFLQTWQELTSKWISKRVYGMLFKADADLKEGINIWGPTTQPASLTRLIKEKLDPHGILNPGRFL